jgi:16S rRNA (guanine527-N7)-methyltransferase
MESDGFIGALNERATLVGVSLTPVLAGQLEAYYRLLTRWNQKINLTALRLEPATGQAIDRLLIEPLAASPFLTNAAVWFDLGSGGGSPAIPLRLANPDVRLIMVESRERKAAFLKETVRELRLGRTAVESDRFEAVSLSHPLAGSADVISVRAVRIDPTLFTAVRALLRPRGRVVLFGARTRDLLLPPDFQVVQAAPAQKGPQPVALSWTGASKAAP